MSLGKSLLGDINKSKQFLLLMLIRHLLNFMPIFSSDLRISTYYWKIQLAASQSLHFYNRILFTKSVKFIHTHSFYVYGYCETFSSSFS